MISLSLNLKDIATISMVLFAVIDIVGAIPVIIMMRKRLGHIQSGKATITALIIMIVFLFLGKEILNLIGIRVSDFAIAGSMVIFFVALEMILGIRLYKDDIPETASIVPLAFPLIAGAGTMTTLLSLRAQYAVENIIIAIVLNMGVVYIVLKTSKHIEKFLGPGGVSVMRRAFGIILLAIAVKLFRVNAGV
jgi:multiple antibiotic resistance protein